MTDLESCEGFFLFSGANTWVRFGSGLTSSETSDWPRVVLGAPLVLLSDLKTQFISTCYRFVSPEGIFIFKQAVSIRHCEYSERLTVLLGPIMVEGPSPGSGIFPGQLHSNVCFIVGTSAGSEGDPLHIQVLLKTARFQRIL